MGFGAVIVFTCQQDLEAKVVFGDTLRMIRPMNSLGGVETTYQFPSQGSHRYLAEDEQKRLGITPHLIRLSVGIEDVTDIVSDLDHALSACCFTSGSAAFG